MKYVVMLGDGMADYPLESLGNKTPLEVAKKPTMDFLCKNGELGLVRTLYEGMPTGSDIANLSVLGYDPKKYYTGRSPIEALGLGINLCDEDTVFRLNLVSISTDGDFEEKVMLDHSSDKITNEEAYELLDALSAEFASDKILFHRGVSYRHVLIWKDIDYGYTMMPPHDILDQKITPYLPGGKYGDIVLSMMKRSYEILMNHPVNIARMEKGLKPANCMWLWGEGTRPQIDLFSDKYGISGSVVTAVPLIAGLANGMGLKYIPVEGATGDYHTNYKGKAEAAMAALDADDFVFIHVEAPDECGHDGDTELKIKSIERIDEDILKPVLEKLAKSGEPYRILLMPDHATPIVKRTHTIDKIPYVIYSSDEEAKSGLEYSEKTAATTGISVEFGHDLMKKFII
ncbi:MAG: cofactor-independent phosphoglycerate mutase [Clostridia bacterium]|nr:cofactor-independent phosphoglycerate mutase [Clostridia bacterium]